jgi:trimethylamine--corrinoid protein Co-methyltransferase
MFRNWTEFLSAADITQIHQTSMKLLAEVGIFFAAEQAVDVLKKQGFKTDGKTVFFEEKQIMAAIEAAPAAAIRSLRRAMAPPLLSTMKPAGVRPRWPITSSWPAWPTPCRTRI